MQVFLLVHNTFWTESAWWHKNYTEKEHAVVIFWVQIPIN